MKRGVLSRHIAVRGEMGVGGGEEVLRCHIAVRGEKGGGVLSCHIHTSNGY